MLAIIAVVVVVLAISVAVMLGLVGNRRARSGEALDRHLRHRGRGPIE